MRKKKDFKLKQYRKRYYAKYPDTPKNYVIHHIDGNHENNDINNLIAIPCTLHARYHFTKNGIGPETEEATDYMRMMNKINKKAIDDINSYIHNVGKI